MEEVIIVENVDKFSYQFDNIGLYFFFFPF